MQGNSQAVNACLSNSAFLTRAFIVYISGQSRTLFGRKVVVAMLEWSKERPDYQRYAALFLLAYTFLLRVPSEAIPTVAGGGTDPSTQAILTLEGGAPVETVEAQE